MYLQPVVFKSSKLLINCLKRDISDQKAEEVSDSDDKAAENDRFGDLEDKIKQLGKLC